jgi:hypothetical protein
MKEYRKLDEFSNLPKSSQPSATENGTLSVYSRVWRRKRVYSQTVANTTQRICRLQSRGKKSRASVPLDNLHVHRAYRCKEIQRTYWTYCGPSGFAVGPF